MGSKRAVMALAVALAAYCLVGRALRNWPPPEFKLVSAGWRNGDPKSGSIVGTVAGNWWWKRYGAQGISVELEIYDSRRFSRILLLARKSGLWEWTFGFCRGWNIQNVEKE